MSDRERLKLFNELCKTCSRHHVIPKSMYIPDCSDGSVEVDDGGFADVSQGTYEGRQVAIKVVRTYVTSDFDVIRSVSALPTLLHPPVDKCILEILPGGGGLEASPASQHPTAARGDVKRTPFRTGFRMDGKWKYQRFHQAGPARKPC